ncbi:MAG: hypothetical protein PF689_05330 [Deltaproteobacteria bacterium]|jgi:hypothetical protein|nr:hypothetical protein [Deltaproteobacteria bacterium]
MSKYCPHCLSQSDSTDVCSLCHSKIKSFPNDLPSSISGWDIKDCLRITVSGSYLLVKKDNQRAMIFLLNSEGDFSEEDLDNPGLPGEIHPLERGYYKKRPFVVFPFPEKTAAGARTNPREAVQIISSLYKSLQKRIINQKNAPEPQEIVKINKSWKILSGMPCSTLTKHVFNHFSAPEKEKFHHLNDKSLTYTCSCIFYYLIKGQPPAGLASPISKDEYNLSPLDLTVFRALSPNPELRPGSKEFITNIQSKITGKSNIAKLANTTFGIAGIFILLAIGIGLSLLLIYLNS